MLIVKHKGFFVIVDTNNNYFAFSESGKPMFTEHLTYAYKWRRKDKATKYLCNGLINSDCQVLFIDEERFRINTNLLDEIESRLLKKIQYSSVEQWVNYMSEMTNGFSEIELPLIQAKEKQDEIEKTITDLRHYIEFGEFNAFQGFRLFRLFQNLLRQRRSCKDIVFLLESASEINEINYIYWCAIQLKCRNYKPRILKTMFNTFVG